MQPADLVCCALDCMSDGDVSFVNEAPNSRHIQNFHQVALCIEIRGHRVTKVYVIKKGIIGTLVCAMMLIILKMTSTVMKILMMVL